MTRTLIGTVAGVLSARSASSATLTDTRDGTDFAIGGLGFRMAITDQRPYERATAPFRKEQFDAAPVVGDQSLSGWWTRGQMSFHKGAGVKFYELLAGEEILDRFHRSENVDPTEAGVVRLPGGSTSKAFSDFRFVAYSSGLSSNRFLVIKSSGSMVEVTVPADFSTATETAVATSDAAAATSVTAKPWDGAWLTNGTKVESWGHGAAASVVQFTMANKVHHIWCLKGRLWLVDEYGRWYMFATDTTGAKTTADAFGILPEFPRLTNEAGMWSACEGPNGIYVAHDRRLYLITLDTSSGTPVPSPPLLVATLPENEEIGHIAYALGVVIMATNRGVRFAAVGSDGAVTYGPLCAAGLDASDVNGIAINGSLVLVPGEHSDHGNGVYAFDLTNMVTDLQPAWHLRTAVTGSLARCGVVATYLGTHLWSEGLDTFTRIHDDDWSWASSNNLVESGFITTGFHRFGTLEPKQFHAVKVRTGGTGGTVTVSKVMSDGSEVSLHTIQANEGQVSDVTLGLSAPQEMLALKFTLTRDATDPTKGPELLGYQLRALPAPRRQRLIRVPLMLHDIEGNSPARATGRDGDAWRRLRALEELEERGGTHVFQDFRTGEAGVCYIESVEHTGATPPGVRDSGFGGVVVLTIRKVDA